MADDSKMQDDLFPEGMEALLGTLARLLLNRGAAREAGLLAESRANLLLVEGHYCLSLRVPEKAFKRLGKNVGQAEQNILRPLRDVVPSHLQDRVKRVLITPMLAAASNWREGTKQQLRNEDPLGHRPHALGVPPKQPDKPQTTESFDISVGGTPELLSRRR